MFDFGHRDELDLVRVWQAFLLANGLSVGSAGADGIFGNDTGLATMEFQAEEGLPATGHVDPETWNRAAARQVPPRLPTDLPPAIVDWYRITPEMRRNTWSGSYAERRSHWVTIHPDIIAAFSPDGDREDGIRRMRAYYQRLESYCLGRSFNMPAPGQTTVHPALRQRLDAALGLLQGRGLLRQAMDSVIDQGGFSIRRIAGGSGLSNHSFGSAIALGAGCNPFVYADSDRTSGGGFPLEEFAFLTGLDSFAGDLASLLGTARARSFDDVLQVVSRHCAASKAVVRAFASPGDLAVALRAALARTGEAAVSHEEALDLLGRGSGATLLRLKARIADTGRWDRISRMGRLLSVLFDATQAALDMQAITDNPGYIARHGWVNLAPELIAALTCKEGGRLRWICAGETHKHAMHFEIFDDEALPLRMQ